MPEAAPRIRVSNTRKKRHILIFRADDDLFGQIAGYMRERKIRTQSRAIRELVLAALSRS